MAGRPRKHSVDETLDRAFEVFWRQGFDATSLGDLTAACEVGPSSLYRTFGSKEGLYAQALERYSTRNSTFVGRALARERFGDAVHDLLLDAVDTFTRQDQPCGCAVLSGSSAEVDHLLVEFRRRIRDLLIARVARAVEDGDLPDTTDADAHGRALFGAMAGLSDQARDGASREVLRRSARVFITALG